MNGVKTAFHSRVPRYHRIAEALRERIRVGELASGARLDNQRALAKSFGVTLMTLRQALEVLERENLIARRHGLGTFVAAPSIDYDILQLRRFAGELSRRASTSPRGCWAGACRAPIVASPTRWAFPRVPASSSSSGCDWSTATR